MRKFFYDEVIERLGKRIGNAVIEFNSDHKINDWKTHLGKAAYDEMFLIEQERASNE